MTGAQVGSDWTTVLKKRQQYRSVWLSQITIQTHLIQPASSLLTHLSIFRDAFSGYDAEIVAKFSEKKIASISAYYGIDLSQVRGVVDNSNRILEVMK